MSSGAVSSLRDAGLGARRAIRSAAKKGKTPAKAYVDRSTLIPAAAIARSARWRV